MKFGVIVHKGDNIGDFIQAVAAKQFSPVFTNDDVLLLEREELSKYDGDEVAVIMNAWFMRHPETGWPPSAKIHPKFISFHINSIAKDQMLSDESVNYMKQYEPIGCRDKYTMTILQEHGIKSYFSGCLTLTLGEKYATNEKSDNIYISELSFPSNKISNCFRNTCVLLRECIFHPFLLFTIFGKINSYPPQTIRRLWDAANILYTYLPCIDKEILKKAIFVNHIISFTDYNQMMTTAEDLVKMYARAKFVITNKIHCAMPCIAVGTPVVWIGDDNGDSEYACRLDGISELFNKISYCKGKAKLNIAGFKEKKLTTKNFPTNPTTFLKVKTLILNKIQEVREEK